MSEEEKKNDTLSDVFDEKTITGDDDSPRRHRRRRRVIQNLTCPLCESAVKHVTYKDIFQLKKFTSVRGKIISSEKSGVCHMHQKQLRKSIKRARYMALLPYVAKD